LVSFCEEVKLQSFYGDPCDSFDSNLSCSLKNICSMEFLKSWIQVPCNQTTDAPVPLTTLDDFLLSPSRDQCCDLSFPIDNKTTFSSCINALADLYYVQDRDSGLFFSSDDDTFVALIISVLSNVPYTDEYKPMDDFYKVLKKFTSAIVSRSPENSGVGTMKFISEFEYYDLQTNIVQSAYSSAGVSFAVALFVLVVMTRSILLTISSVVTIMAVVFVIGGIVVSIGWDLNILESIIVSISVGLSVDFTVHYSHSYLHSPDKSSRITYMYKVMGVSVATGAFTTFISGAALCFAQTLFYYQFGIFLVITMVFSFTFSTFLLPSILCIFGPLDDQNEGKDDNQNETGTDEDSSSKGDMVAASVSI